MAGVVTIVRPRRPARSGASATGTAVVLAAVTGFGLSTQLSAPTERTNAGYQPPMWLLALTATATVTVIAASGLTLTAGREPGVLWGLALMLAAVLLPIWAGWPAIPATAAPLLLAAGPLVVAGIAAVAGADRARGVLVLSLLAAATLALGYDPFADVACYETCAERRPPLDGMLSTGSAITVAGGLTLVAIGLAGAGLRSRGASGWRVRVPAATTMGLLAMANGLRLTAGPDPFVNQVQRALPAFAVTAMAGAIVIMQVRVRRTRLATELLVAGLSAPESVLVARGSRVTGMLFAVPGSARWVDGSGTDVDPPVGPHLVLSDAGDPVARLQLSDPGDEPAVLAALTQAARLALRNAQLTAAGKARLAEVRASRRRIVGTADAERRRIERDLHDGAQQRLVSVALHLQIALVRVAPPAADALRDAETGVREVLVRLRRLAHGVQSAALAEEGLAAALEELADGSTVPMMLDVQVGETLPVDAATAAYVTIADTIDGCHVAALPPGTRVAVRARQGRGEVTVNLDVPAASDTSATEAAHRLAAALTEADDRVAALGGTLTVVAGNGGARVTAVIPCES